jgi:HK97 family phage prohead protease
MGDRMTMERRSLTAPVEFRESDDGKKMVAGHAAVFNVITDIGGMFREKIAPGAFADTIDGGDIRSLFDHNSALILGRTKSKTLRLWEDESGLRYEVDLPDTQAGRDLRVSMDRGDIDGSSFAFRILKQSWDESGDVPLRTIEKVELYEVGPVTFPAYPEAEVGLRSLAEFRKENPEDRSGVLRFLARSAMDIKLKKSASRR